MKSIIDEQYEIMEALNKKLIQISTFNAYSNYMTSKYLRKEER